MIEFSPQNTIAIILGAHEWPKHTTFDRSESFLNSACAIKEYFTNKKKFGILKQYFLDLFDSDQSRIEIIKQIDKFISDSIDKETKKKIEITDLILYYIGHGIAPSSENEFSLAIKDTEERYEYLTALSIKDLANCLNKAATHLRRYIILDCCFAGEAAKYFMSTANPITKWAEKYIPPSGTALICAANKDQRARAPQSEKFTMFTGAILDVLSSGARHLGKRISLIQLYNLVRDKISERPIEEQVLPEIYNPKQIHGTLSNNVPIFPNPAFFAEDLQHEEETKNPMFEAYIQQLILLFKREGENVTFEEIKYLKTLSKSACLYVISRIAKDAIEGYYYNSTNIVQFIEYLLSSIFSYLELSNDFRTRFLTRLWKEDENPIEIFYIFLIKDVIKFSDIENISNLLSKDGMVTANFLVPYSIWENRILKPNKEYEDKVNKINHKLIMIARRHAHQCAQNSKIDSEYENAALHNELINEFEGRRIWELESPIADTGPLIFSKLLYLIEYYNSFNLKNFEDIWSIRDRFHFVGQLAISFSKRGHWGISRECLKFLLYEKAWADHKDRWMDIYSKDLTAKGNPYTYVSRKAREVINRMRNNNAPIRWEIVILLDIYKSCYKDILGFGSLFTNHKSHILTKIYNRLQQLAEKLANDPNREKTHQAQFVDIVLMDNLREFVWYNTLNKIHLSKKSIQWLVEQRIKYKDTFEDLRWYYDRRLRTHIDLISDSLSVDNAYLIKNRLNYLTKRTLEEFSYYPNASFKNEYRRFIRDVEECVKIFNKIQNTQPIKIKSDILNKITRIKAMFDKLKKEDKKKE